VAPRSQHGMPDYRASYRWTMVIITVAFLILLMRFFVLQIARTQEYQQDQQRTKARTERLPARRGLVVDRNGVVLAQNVETHDLVMVPYRVKDARKVEELLRKHLSLTVDEEQTLAELIRVGIENREKLDTVVLRQDLVSEHCPFGAQKLERLDVRKRTLWSATSGRSYFPTTSAETRCPHDRSKPLEWNAARTLGRCPDGLEYASASSDPVDGSPLVEKTWSLRCPADGRLYNNEKAILEAALYEMPGIEIRTSLRRVYPQKNLVSHLVGYVNQISAKDLEANPGEYLPNDRAGRTGVERSFEKELRGQWGQRNTLLERMGGDGPVVEVANPNKPDKPVVDGATIRLTIDVRLQEAAQQAMRYHKSGAAVVMDVKTGEILALYSKPTFDPNLWAGRLPADVLQETNRSPYSPMLNKALTAYAPGSVYKLITATAGLHTHSTDFKREVMCPGYFEYGGRRFRCHLRTGHGSMDLVHAMARSCDIFFYKLGEEMGMDTLYHYATQYFGLGGPSGIEIGESFGLVPTREWHRKRDGVFMPGFTVSTAVGQKDIRLTPLQITRSYVAVANGGLLLDAHVLKQVEDRNGRVLRASKPTGSTRLPLTEDELAGLKEGFWRTVNDEHGTAFEARIPGVGEVAGKTGTAEAAERKAGVTEDIARWLEEDHAWFSGYAPARNPEIALTVFVEHGLSGGKMAGPVAMQIVKAYLDMRNVDARPGTHVEPNPIRSEPTRITPPPQGPPAPPEGARRNGSPSADGAPAPAERDGGGGQPTSGRDGGPADRAAPRDSDAAPTSPAEGRVNHEPMEIELP
jgi:penicillin-binding protein 2